MAITTQARTVVLHNEELLLLRCKYEDGVYWVLPGGRQDFGETIEDCARRETLEETNLPVTIERPLYLQEVLKSKQQSLVLFFLAKPAGDPLKITHEHDPDATETRILGVEWVPLARVTTLRQRQPDVIRQVLLDRERGWAPGVRLLSTVRR
ncbi:NUDIX hydrolase [Candidatus Woesearchaeota archaeon]|nr:MAG: NUDIX hydrolase [Candidatus Woesearchaeota archaeon]